MLFSIGFSYLQIRLPYLNGLNKNQADPLLGFYIFHLLNKCFVYIFKTSIVTNNLIDNDINALYHDFL